MTEGPAVYGRLGWAGEAGRATEHGYRRILRRHRQPGRLAIGWRAMPRSRRRRPAGDWAQAGI